MAMWEASEWVEVASGSVAALVAIACALRFVALAIGRLVRIRRRRARPRASLRVLVLATVGLPAAPVPVSASSITDVGSPPTAQPSEGDPTFAPPWSDSAGSHPPRPFDRTREELSSETKSPSAGPAARTGPRIEDRYKVETGDTLWGISSLTLDTKNLRRIAGYWPVIHRHNRSVIGPDPDLIRPGQLLVLPREARP